RRLDIRIGEARGPVVGVRVVSDVVSAGIRSTRLAYEFGNNGSISGGRGAITTPVIRQNRSLTGSLSDRSAGLDPLTDQDTIHRIVAVPEMRSAHRTCRLRIACAAAYSR